MELEKIGFYTLSAEYPLRDIDNFNKVMNNITYTNAFNEYYETFIPK